jgi:DNA-binding protein H-NS
MISQIIEITSSIEELDAQRAQLEAALAEAKGAAKEHVIQTVRDMIAEAGFTAEEILHLVAPQPKTARAKAKANGDGRTFPTYALKSDPTRTYVRGVLPGWLKEAMMAAGFDPAQGADRAAFKDIHMLMVSA